MTGAAVIRVGLRVQARIGMYHFLRPAVLLLAAATLGVWQGWLRLLQSAAAGIASQAAYARLLYTGHAVSMPASGWRSAVAGAALRGLLGSATALLLAVTSIFRGKLARWARVGAFLQGGVRLLMTMQADTLETMWRGSPWGWQLLVPRRWP